MEVESLYVRPSGDRVDYHAGHDATCPLVMSVPCEQMPDFLAEQFAAYERAKANERWTTTERKPAAYDLGGEGGGA